MKNFGKVLLALVLFFGIISSVLIIKNGKINLTPYSYDKYISDLTEIYQKYDTDRDSLDPSDTYGLRRLIVNDYNGKRYGCTARAWDKKNGFAVLQYETREEAEHALSKIKEDGLSAEPDALGWLDSSYATMYPTGSNYMGTKQYNDKLRSTPMTKEDIIVAVIDSGVMYDNSYISDRFYSNGVDLSGDGCDDAYYETAEPEGEDYYHSTAVCGVIADNTPDNVKILPIKVVPFNGESIVASNVASAINYAVDNGAQVINLSLYTTGAQSAIQRAVNNALNQKVCVCASAGNGKKENGVYVPNYIENRYPTCTEGVIVVGALDGAIIRDDNGNVTEFKIYESIAAYSNYGEEVDFAAPGTKVVSCSMSGGVSKRMAFSGTSFSTPYISACCADIKTVNSDLSRDEIYEILKDFSRDLGDEGRDDYFGWGVPKIDNIVYTDGESYSYRIPEGTLNITQSVDYTAQTQPWRYFADRLTDVTVSDNITEIGDYMFCGMENAQFTMPDSFMRVGECAFKDCVTLTDMTFPIDVTSVGANAFEGIDNFTIHGYRNTPAEDYAITYGVNFDILGCRHNYVYESFDPSSTQAGYTVYTCTVCGDTYIGEYIPPVTLDTGVCGDNLAYTFYDSGKLTIDGTGDMYDYLNSPAPWDAYRNEITILQINQYVEKLSPFAFYGCKNVSKIRLDESNAYYQSDTVDLISAQDKELVLTCARGEYYLSEEVEKLSPTAFFTAGAISFNGNSRFHAENKLVYDNSGNIVMALPGYSASTLNIDNNITIKKYAFILTEYPAVFDSKRLNITHGEYCIGYYYNGTMTKRDMTFRVSADSLSYQYAVENDFTVNGYDVGKCGDDLIWQYNSGTKTLSFIGSGDMYNYSSEDIPWKSVISSVQTINISDEVTSLSPYSFGGAAALRTLVMPLSLPAPDNTIWSGCTGITSLTLTLGSGRTDDYEGDSFTYSPWYLSRSKITEFSLDENVRYIGVQAFRSCSAIKSITLNCIEEINTNAFLACAKASTFTIYNKDAVIADYSIMSYYASGEYHIYPGKKLYAYADSTAHDYAENLSATFISLGCGHSRSVVLIDDGTYCTECETRYHCNDCDSDFTEYYSGHNASFTLLSTNGAAVPNANIRANGIDLGTTSYDGTLSCNLRCDEYDIEVEVNTLIYDGFSLTVNEADVNAQITVRYGDFNSDGIINAKDYAYSLKRGYSDKALFDWGRMSEGDNNLTVS